MAELWLCNHVILSASQLVLITLWVYQQQEKCENIHFNYVHRVGSKNWLPKARFQLKDCIVWSDHVKPHI